MTKGFVSLMYHELERPRRALCRSDAGYVRYVVEESEFRRQLTRIRDLGLTGASVGEARRSDSERRVVAITFDDGCASDLDVAAPILSEFGFSATFYITLDFLGRPGFLTPSSLRELSRLGFEIGCHGATHRYLTDLSEDDRDLEIRAAGIEISALAGAPVRHFSCPGGRWTPSSAEIARAAGYESFATSDPGTSAPTDFLIRRSPVMRQTSIEAFSDLALFRRQGARRAKAAALGIAKSVIGNASYERFRNLLLRDSHDGGGES